MTGLPLQCLISYLKSLPQSQNDVGKSQACSLGRGRVQSGSCESLARPDEPCESLGVIRCGLAGGSGASLEASATWTHVCACVCFFFSSVGSSEFFHGCVTQENASTRWKAAPTFPAVAALLHSFQCLATTAPVLQKHNGALCTLDYPNPPTDRPLSTISPRSCADMSSYFAFLTQPVAIKESYRLPAFPSRPSGPDQEDALLGDD